MYDRYVIKLKLHEVMKKKNISAKELSDMSGISKSEIYHICNNKKNPTLYTMLVIASAMGVDLSELYDFRENCLS